MKKTILMTLMLAFGMTMMAQKTVQKVDKKAVHKLEQKSDVKTKMKADKKSDVKTKMKADKKSDVKTEQNTDEKTALKPAEIKFDKQVQSFGKFSEKNAVHTAVFTFTNVGEQPLVINQATAACGCTVPEFTSTPIQPGEQGTIKVTYNGEGMFPGPIRKSVTVRTNGAVPTTRIYIEGEMVEEKK
jgi:hypothetical protein